MTDIATSFTPPRQDRSLVQTLSALGEIMLVIGASLAAGIAVGGWVSPSLPEALGLLDGQPPDFLAATWALGLQLAVQYAVLFGLAQAFGLMRGRRLIPSYALGAPDRMTHAHPWLYGLTVGLVAGLIPTGVLILQDIAPIGRDTPLWPVLRNAELTWRFYLFVSVGSFVLIPVIEELAWRGYVLGRLLEGFAPGAALIISTLGFSALHLQYLVADPALILMFVGLVLVSMMFGLCVLRTGSIWPAVLAHAVLNLPPPTELLIMKFVAGLIVLVVLFRPIQAELMRLAALMWRWSSLAGLAGLAAIASVVLLAVAAPHGPWLAGGVSLACALGLGLIRRSAWRPALPDETEPGPKR